MKSSAAREACEYLTKALGTSPLLLTELDLSEDKLGDLDGEKLSALLMDSHCKVEKMKWVIMILYIISFLYSVTCESRYEELLIWCVLNMCWIKNNAVFVFRLNNCRLTEKSCSVLSTVLSSKTILKEMNLNNSRLLDSGVKEICEGLKNPVCELKILKWVHFTVSYTQHSSNHWNIIYSFSLLKNTLYCDYIFNCSVIKSIYDSDYCAVINLIHSVNLSFYFL